MLKETDKRALRIDPVAVQHNAPRDGNYVLMINELESPAAGLVTPAPHERPNSTVGLPWGRREN